MKFVGQISMTYEIECETGLHIGDEGTLQIGGIDGPVVKDPETDHPYIPASSLKGKLRSQLEWATGNVTEDGGVHWCSDESVLSCPVCRLFGVPAEVEEITGPTRLIIRDAYPNDETVEKWEEFDMVLPYTELKSENWINRLTAEATPRTNERVPKGSVFETECTFRLFDLSEDSSSTDNEPEDLQYLSYLATGFELLEGSWLGGNGSRGYGSVTTSLTNASIAVIENTGDDIAFAADDSVCDDTEEVQIESLVEQFRDKLPS